MGNELKGGKPKVITSNELQTYIMIVKGKLTQQRNKKVFEISKKRKELLNFLKDNNPEMAKLKMDGIIQEENFVTACDILGTVMEILKEKCTYLLQSVKCPNDMRATLDTVIFASTRCEIEEFANIRDLITQKYGGDYVSRANNNLDKLVNKQIVDKLTFTPNPEPFLISRIKQICKEEAFEYTFPQEVIPIDFNLVNSGGLNSQPYLNFGATPEKSQMDTNHQVLPTHSFIDRFGQGGQGNNQNSNNNQNFINQTICMQQNNDNPSTNLNNNQSNYKEQNYNQSQNFNNNNPNSNLNSNIGQSGFQNMNADFGSGPNVNVNQSNLNMNLGSQYGNNYPDQNKNNNNQGNQGYQGYQENQGNQGNQGYQENKGYQGNQGNQGYQGNKGKQENQGNQGYQENQGNQGNLGNQVNQGSQLNQSVKQVNQGSQLNQSVKQSQQFNNNQNIDLNNNYNPNFGGSQINNNNDNNNVSNKNSNVVQSQKIDNNNADFHGSDNQVNNNNYDQSKSTNVVNNIQLGGMNQSPSDQNSQLFQYDDKIGNSQFVNNNQQKDINPTSSVFGTFNQSNYSQQTGGLNNNAQNQYSIIVPNNGSNLNMGGQGQVSDEMFPSTTFNNSQNNQNNNGEVDDFGFPEVKR